MFLQQVINSLMIGSLYALTAMGATLIYGILGILDIANAGAYLLGAYVGYYVYTATGSLVLAFLVAMAVIGLLGVVLHRTIYGPILAKPRTLSIIPLVAAVGLFTVSSDAVRLICGAGTKAYNFRFPVDVIHLGSVSIQTNWILIFALTALLLVILWIILNKTKMGLAWRATAEDPDIARACGVNTNSAMALSYILGYGFAAAAGIMTGILYNSITPALGEVPSYKMLAIIVLGGLGNPLGTVVAGLIIGFAEVMLSTYTKLPIPKDAIAFVVLIIVLLIKPSGLFGQRNKVLRRDNDECLSIFYRCNSRYLYSACLVSEHYHWLRRTGNDGSCGFLRYRCLYSRHSDADIPCELFPCAAYCHAVYRRVRRVAWPDLPAIAG